MILNEKIDAFSELGRILRDSLKGEETRYSSDLEQIINNQQFKNPWFTPENVTMAIKAVADELTYENLTKWTSHYPAIDSVSKIMNVGVVMAGNIPLVGFHDLLSVLITGHNLIAKTSSKDPELIGFISDILCDINQEFKNRIVFTEGLLKGIDAVIATGSDNTSRYFEYNFGKYPHIIRKNRNSIAIIDGSETETELSGLGSDVLSYFGLGCRNVSKVYFPKGYDIRKMAISWCGYSSLINHNKYWNNYYYNRAVFMVNQEEFVDIGYLLFKESSRISSPVAVLYYEFYNYLEDVYQDVEKFRDKIQCVVSRNDIPFGRAQLPHLWDYADGIDTVDFLLKKN